MLMKFIATCLVLTSVVGSALAGIRGPGKYAGIVIFDRWDTCYLYSGIYLMYVSEKTKESLRKHEGQSILLYAKEVYQPINPGDGRIGKFKVLGSAQAKRDWASIAGLSLTVTPQFDTENPKFLLEVENNGGTTAEVLPGELALTLLGIKRRDVFSPSDGKSDAWLTRQPLKFPSFVEDMAFGPKKSNKSHHLMWKDSDEYYFDVEEKLPDTVKLRPDEKKSIALSFHLPKGEYDFLCGYAGGVHSTKGLASNRVSFDVDESGRAAIASVARQLQPASNNRSRLSAR